MRRLSVIYVAAVVLCTPLAVGEKNTHTRGQSMGYGEGASLRGIKLERHPHGPTDRLALPQCDPPHVLLVRVELDVVAHLRRHVDELRQVAAGGGELFVRLLQLQHESAMQGIAQSIAPAGTRSGALQDGGQQASMALQDATNRQGSEPAQYYDGRDLNVDMHRSYSDRKPKYMQIEPQQGAADLALQGPGHTCMGTRFEVKSPQRRICLLAVLKRPLG